MSSTDTTAHIETISDLVKDVKFAMMTTVTADGHLHACPMTTNEFDLTKKEIWFIADANTETVSDIKANPQVNLSYTSQNNKDYLSINGRAELVTDPEQLDKLWSPLYNAFFADGKDDANIQLIKVVPNGAQYWLSGNSIINMFKLTASAVKGGKVADSLGENASVSF